MSNIEKIRQEIERRLKYTHDWLRGDEKRHPKQTAISKNYYKMKGDERTLDALLAFIDSLPEEKPSEDLEEEIQMEWDSFNKHIAKYSEGTDEVVWLNWLSFVDIANYFYELGLNAKEDKK